MGYNQQYLRLLFLGILFKAVNGDFGDFDFSLLDEVEVCQIQQNIQDDNQYAFTVENSDIDHFTSFSNASEKCKNTLVIRPLEELVSDLHRTSSRQCEDQMHFVKDPFSSLLFTTTENLKLPKELFAQWSCLYPLQPYFFVLVDLQSNQTMFEIQVYSQSIEMVWQFSGAKLTDFRDIYERRKHFNGTKLRVHFDNYNPDGYIQNGQFVGYNADLFGILQQTMNFTVELWPIQIYGVQLPNGTFSGTIHQLLQSETDIAVASYTQLPSRLEAVDPLFTTRMVKNVLFYWKNQNVRNTLYIAVFSPYFWYFVLLATFVSSLYYTFLIKLLKNKRLGTILIPIKSLGLLDFDMDFKSVSLKVFTTGVVFTSSLLYWCYSGSLISYLTNDNDSPPFTRFEDLLALPSFKVLMMEGAAPSQTLLSAAQRNPEMNKVLEQNVIYTSSELFLEAFTTQSPDKVGIYDYYNLVKELVIKQHYDESILCQISWVQLEDGAAQIPQGWLLPKNSLLKKIFDKHLIEISAAGIDHHLLNKYFGHLTSPDFCSSQLVIVDYSMVGILFYLLTGGSILGLIFLVFEWIWKLRFGAAGCFA